MAFQKLFLRSAYQKCLQNYDLAHEDINHLAQFVQHAADHELFRVNPRFLAGRLGWSDAFTLDVLTMAVAENLWSLEWEVYCPACGHLMQRDAELGELAAQQQCEMCDAQADIHLDEEVTPRLSVRDSWQRLKVSQDDAQQFRAQVDAEYGRTPALHLINRPYFREKLGIQVLPPDHSLGVQHLAVFFSDLKASTRMYQKLGDAAAYHLVRQHFDVVFAAVERHGGSAVKTIGDGVMGTFFENAAALNGVIESVRGLAALNHHAGLTGEDCLRLKVGLHAGQCIVVTLNGRLDYFGSTVNIAARLSDQAEGNDIWLSKAVLEDSAARQIADALKCDRDGSITLRGIRDTIEVCRLQL